MVKRYDDNVKQILYFSYLILQCENAVSYDIVTRKHMYEYVYLRYFHSGNRIVCCHTIITDDCSLAYLNAIRLLVVKNLYVSDYALHTAHNMYLIVHHSE